MSSNDTAGCSSAGDPLRTVSKLTRQDKSTQHDARSQKTPSIGESMRSRPQASSADDSEMFDEFLRDQPPEFDLSGSLTPDIIAEMSHPQASWRAAQNFEARDSTWRDEAKIFREGTGQEDKEGMLKLEAAWELAQLRDSYVSDVDGEESDMFSSDTPYMPMMRDRLMKLLKRLRRSDRVAEAAAGAQGTCAPSRAESIMGKLMGEGDEDLSEGCVRDVPPVLLYGGVCSDHQNSTRILVPRLHLNAMPYDDETLLPGGGSICRYFLRGEVEQGLHRDMCRWRLSRWADDADFTCDPHYGPVAITDGSMGVHWAKEQAVLNVTDFSVDFATKEGKKADIIVVADTSVYNPQKIPTTAWEFAPKRYKYTKEVLAEHSGRLCKLFEKHPNLNTLIIADTPEVIVAAMIEFMHWGYVPHHLEIFYKPTRPDPASGATGNQQKRMHYWEYYLALLQAAFKYDMVSLQEICIAALTQDDIFNGYNFLDPYGPHGRTLMGEMLNQLDAYVQNASGYGWDDCWSSVLWDIWAKQVPKIAQGLDGPDGASCGLCADMKDVFEIECYADDWRERLTKTKQDFEDLVEDKDGIWTLQLKPDALRLRSKL